MDSPVSSRPTLQGLERACARVVLALALLVLATWASGRWWITALGAGYVPMAPSTALLLLALSGAVLVRNRWPGSPAASRTVAAASLVTLSFAGLLLSGLTGIPGAVDDLLGGARAVAGGIPAGRMSLLTGVGMVLSALGLLFSHPLLASLRPSRAISGSSSLGAALLGLVSLTGYLTRAPLLYGSGLVPMAAATALGFLLLGTALLAGGDRRQWVLRALTREGGDPGTGNLDLGIAALALGSTALISLLGYQVLERVEDGARKEAERSLNRMAELRILSIEQWLEERRRDAESQLGSPEAARLVRGLLADGGPPGLREEASRWLQRLRESEECLGTEFLDLDLTPILRSPGFDEGVATLPPLPPGGFPEGSRFLIRDHSWGPGGVVQVDLLVPVLDPGAGGAPPIALLVMHIDPAPTLFRLLRTRVDEGSSAESILTRRDGSRLVSLSGLRYDGGNAALRRLPPVDSPLFESGPPPSWTRAVEGLDYRGVPVLAVLRPVVNSPWQILVKEDLAEVLGTARAGTWVVLLLMGIMTGVSWLAVALLWRRREAHHLRGLISGESERRRMALRVDQLMRGANDIILITDGEGRILEVNERAETTYGLARRDLLGRSLEDLRPPGGTGGPPARFLQDEGGAATFETFHVRGDGSSFPVEVRMRVVDIEGDRRGFAIVRDVTELRAHIQAIERLSRLYAVLSETKQALIRSSTVEQALRKACEVAVARGGYLSARILRPDPDGGRPATVACSGRPEPVPGEEGIVAAVLAEGDPVIRSLSDEGGALPGPGSPREIAVFPMKTKGSGPWALVLEGRDAGTFARDGIRLVEEIAADLSFSIDHFKAEDERKAALAVLKESEERFRSLTEIASDGVVLLDHRGRVSLWNAGAEKLFAVPRATALGRAIADFLVPGQDRATWEEGLRWLVDSGEAEAVGRAMEMTGIRGDGSEFEVEVSLSTTRIRDRWNAICIIRDLGRRRRSEEKVLTLSRAVEQSPVSILITDTEGTIQYVNPEFTRVSGYSSEEAVGASPGILNSGYHPPEFYASLWRSIKAGREWNGEFRNRRKDGTHYWETATISPVADPAGRITHFVAVKLDITERRILEDQFRQSQKMEAVGRLAGGVAHDFNNLLTVISGFTELALGRMEATDRNRAYMEEVERAATRAAGLTRQLLAFSRRQVLQVVPTDLGEVLAGIEKMLHRLLGEDIDLRLELSPGLGTVLVDPGQMEQAIVNLCVNSRDAMPRGGNLVLSVENHGVEAYSPLARAGTPPGNYVRLSVADSGTGMTTEVRDHIFEPFFTTKDKGKGTGLGLAQVYGIVSQSGGRIEVESEPGQGTTFRILLPHCDEQAEEAPDAAAAPVEGRPSAGGRILIVEDEAAVAAVAESALKASGYGVVVAGSQEQLDGIIAGDAGEFDLLLTDVVMPGKNGRQVAELVLGRWPEASVLYMSGYTEDVISRHGVLDPGIEFLSKPFSPKTLRNRVREVLDRRSRRGGTAAPPA